MRWNVAKTSCIAWALWLSAVSAHAAGGLGATVLNLGVGARAEAMAGAFVAVANDVSAVYWNPAGIGQLTEPRVSGLHTEWLGGLRYEWAGFVQPVADWGSLGFSGRFLFGGDVTHTVATAGGFEERGTFDYATRHIRFAFGTRMIGRVRLGAALELLSQELDFSSSASDITPQSASSQTGHLGGIYYVPAVPGLRVAAALRNLGGGSSFLDEDAPLPRTLQAGVAYERRIQTLDAGDLPPPTEEGGQAPTTIPASVATLAFDLRLMRDQGLAARAGVEYRLRNGMAFRGGYRSDGAAELATHLTGGLGYATESYQIDYAFVPMGDLGNAHRAEFSLVFR